MRFVQRNINGQWVLVPHEHDKTSNPGTSIVKGNFEAFASPIDGSVISTQRKLSEHCKQHNVVPAQEFSQQWYADKAAERARQFTGERTPAERRAIRQEIYNNWIAAERG